MIDWERIEELRVEIGEEGFAEVVEIFLDEVAETLTDLRDMPKGAARAGRLHFLKGTALNLGFAELAEMCRAAEMDQNSTSTEAIDCAFHAAKDALMRGVGCCDVAAE